MHVHIHNAMARCVPDYSLDWHTFHFAWNSHENLSSHLSLFAIIFLSFLCTQNPKHTLFDFWKSACETCLYQANLNVSCETCKHLNTKTKYIQNIYSTEFRVQNAVLRRRNWRENNSLLQSPLKAIVSPDNNKTNYKKTCSCSL